MDINEERLHHPENDPAYMGLKVNEGVAAQPMINPNLRRVARRTYTVDEFVAGILASDITCLSQAVTLVGITGVPGAGKSTSIDTFGMHLVKQGRKLAVLAIDPSSERSGGSILGDKTRMEQLSREKNAFIRPSPTAGSLGGVARKTRETIILCEAAGFDTIFVETVGVGQSETAVHSMVDFFLLIQLAGTGDELQGIKRGIMEMADAIVINKADGDNIDKANLAASHFRNALHLFPPTESGWRPKVLTYSGFYGIGIKEIWDMIDEYRHFAMDSGYFTEKRQRQAKWWMYESINDALKASFYQNERVQRLRSEVEHQVLSDTLSSFVGAQHLLDTYFEALKGK